MTSDANAKAARSVFDAAGIVFEVIDDKHWRVPAITPGQLDYHFFPDTAFGAVPTARKRAAALGRL